MARYVDRSMKVYHSGNARLYHEGEALHVGWSIDPDGSGGCHPLDWRCLLSSAQLVELRDRYSAGIPERDARRAGMLRSFGYAIEARQRAEIHTVPEEVKPCEPFPW